MIKLIVIVAFLLAGTPSTWVGTYNVKSWDSVEACQAFVNSDEGQASLSGLKVATILQTGDETLTITPKCLTEEEAAAVAKEASQ